MVTEAELDDLDRELLNAVQWDFPLDTRPFATLAGRLGVDEPTVRARVAKVKAAGVLRQLSALTLNDNAENKSDFPDAASSASKRPTIAAFSSKRLIVG